MIKIRIYTVKELSEGIIADSQTIPFNYSIAPSRAYALINNPCAHDDDPAIVVVSVSESPVGYSAVFAEEYLSGNTRGHFFWGTTEWLEPEYRGKGIAGEMMRTLKDAVGIEKYIGLESSVASVKLDQKQGASIRYYDKLKYQFVSHGSLKGWLFQRYCAWYNHRVLHKLQKYSFQNQYVNYIDEITYQFIKKHSKNNLFMRKREMLNWMLHYPFLIGTHGDSNAKIDTCEFGSLVDEYRIEIIKVYVADELVGLYIVTQTNKERTLRYLYLDELHKNEVLASVTLNLLKPNIEQIHFMSSELQEFMQGHGIKHLNRKSYIDKISLTLPPGLSVNPNLNVQGGDGDMFC